MIKRIMKNLNWNLRSEKMRLLTLHMNQVKKIRKTLHDFTSKKSTQEEATMLIATLVTSCSLPHVIVEKEAFKNLISKLS